ncbi:hypothetical protein [Actinocatenispora sera]|uniref:WXG100 family type VII secretion target n=1 Tax=Actinocatenispora sera TaxID=390989 RepID=A0A810L9Z5_9ACTN|nr:hypothetical protein [Actinocatenispora sera]BCJ32103.1 hypothetical protein Asera_62110 [Actinocatenispora sera]
MDGQYQAAPEAMRATVGNVSAILVQAINALHDLSALMVEPESFATLGSAVATANTELQGQQIVAVRSLLDLLGDTADSVRRSADDYAQADRQVAQGYSAGSSPLWHDGSAAQLAGQAVTDSAGATGTPHSVDTVLGYLSDSGLGELAYRPAPVGRFADAADFADWLDGDPDHQSRLGVIGVYSGQAGGLADVPGVARGDVVIASPADGGTGPSIIGVAGGDGQLYNHGPVGPDLPDESLVRVYRPLA